MKTISETITIGSAEAKIAVLGLGHVGLPTALGLAELGWETIGADDDRAKIAVLKAGKPPFHEPGLQESLSKHLLSGRFRLTDDVEGAVRSASTLFICVGTPQRESGEADLSQVEAVTRIIARNLNGYKLIVEKSTVPAITAHWIKRTIERYASAKAVVYAKNGTTGLYAYPRRDGATSTRTFDVASNPEFLREGNALADFFHPTRIVCGVESARARNILTEIYGPLKCPILVTNLATAELIKHASNAFLATKISFINMVADLCEAVGADVTKIAKGMGMDPRIGPDFLRPGIGFGGYCLPKDLRAVTYLAEEHGVDFSLLKHVERINQLRIPSFLRKVRRALWVLRGKTLAILGLAFKPGTDDIREAPSIKIIKALLEEGAILRLYDPQAMSNMQSLFPEEGGRITYCSSSYEAAHGAHALLLLTEWEEFRKVDLTRMREVMEVPVFVDGRNLYDPEQLRMAGFDYLSIGR
jgi:UDPglucose 6-dehydrogenase